jgi:hypothetical protein
VHDTLFLLLSCSLRQGAPSGSPSSFYITECRSVAGSSPALEAGGAIPRRFEPGHSDQWKPRLTVRTRGLYPRNWGSIPWASTVAVSCRLLGKIVTLVNAGSTPACHPKRPVGEVG